MNPKISIIVPLFNAEKFVAESLESIFNQTFKDFELILVDDGSSDRTVDIASRLIVGRENAILIKQENSGAAIARNRGFKVSRGEYVVFLDADDLFHPSLLEEMHSAAVESSADVCVCQSRGFDSNSGETIRLFHTPAPYNSGVFSTKELHPKLFQVFFGHPWDKLIKRSLIEENELSFQNLKKSNDNYFVYSALLCSNVICILDKELVDYRCESGSSIQDGISSNNICILKAAEALNSRPDLPSEAVQSLRIWSFEAFLRAFGLSARDECLAQQIYDEFDSKREMWGLNGADSLVGAPTLTRFKYWCFRRLSFEGLLGVYSNRSESRYQSSARKVLLAAQMLIRSIVRR